MGDSANKVDSEHEGATHSERQCADGEEPCHYRGRCATTAECGTRAVGERRSRSCGIGEWVCDAEEGFLGDVESRKTSTSEGQPLLPAAVRLAAVCLCFVEGTVDIVRTSPLRQSVDVSCEVRQVARNEPVRALVR